MWISWIKHLLVGMGIGLLFPYELVVSAAIAKELYDWTMKDIESSMVMLKAIDSIFDIYFTLIGGYITNKLRVKK